RGIGASAGAPLRHPGPRVAVGRFSQTRDAPASGALRAGEVSSRPGGLRVGPALAAAGDADLRWLGLRGVKW
ncbi:MAG TPA: hypothetical protein VFV05_14200, partial [Methylomirabilota bacterium]|nr:hypothetical protein [Methylomirabilota bacterium]